MLLSSSESARLLASVISWWHEAIASDPDPRAKASLRGFGVLEDLAAQGSASLVDAGLMEELDHEIHAPARQTAADAR